MTFASRRDAGEKLGRHLLELRVRGDVVVGLPRGGVLVGLEVADVLGRPLDVLVVRKIGHPQFREFAVGALAEGDVVLLDEEVLENAGVDREALDRVIAEEAERLKGYQRKFEGPRPPLKGESVILVDDGLATGATTEAAVQSARKQGAERVTVAVPVASASGFDRLRRVSDEVIALQVDAEFEAVGQYYASFPQATDEEVLEALNRGR